MAAVILYELNEVPWTVIDRFVESRPGSNVARLLAQAECRTTHNADPDDLSPWSTWPTFHRGMFRAEHNSWELGQDPTTFRGTDMWEVVEAAGLPVGLFGVLQSWPPRPFTHGGFHVPDTFARTAETIPSSLERFQDFNLTLTTEMGFSADRPLSAPRLVRAGVDLVARGLSPWSIRRLVGQLIRERRDARFKAARSIMQVLPAFDLYFRLHRSYQPALSIFFTNHVAGMMHRFWGDAFPDDYADANDYAPDPVFGGLVMEAMDLFDHQLGRLFDHVDDHPGTILVVAASMGQGPIPYRHVAETYVVEDAEKLVDTLGIGPAEPAMAMYPMYALDFETADGADRARHRLGSVEVGGAPLFDEVTVLGSSVAYKVRSEFDGDDLDRGVRFATPDGQRTGRLRDLGLDTDDRLGGGNTAYHVPDGIFTTYGQGIEADDSRERFDVRDAATRILDHLGLADAWSATRG